MAYAELEPFGPLDMQWQMAVIAATVANANRDPKRRSQAFTPQDFMREEPLTDRERGERLRSKFDAAMMALGGRERRPGEVKARPGTFTKVTEPPPKRGGRKVGQSRPITPSPPVRQEGARGTVRHHRVPSDQTRR